MKKFFFISSNGFPSIHNKNTGIFTFEQVKAINSKHLPILIDLQTNKSNKIYCNNFEKIKIHRLLYTKYNLIRAFKNLIYLFRLKKKYNPDLLICSFLNLKNVFYTYFLRVKTVTIIHGSDAVVINKLKKIVYYFYLIYNHKIITVSNFTKKVLLTHFKNIHIKKKIKVVHNGFSKDKFKVINKKFLHKIPQNKIIISCIANAVPRKNIPFLINIFYELEAKYPNKYFLIIAGGYGPETKKINNLIVKYKLTKKILFKQNLSNNKIATILKFSNFFCLFSKEFNGEFEGFGIVFIEAMFTKNIVLSSNHGGIREIVINNKNGYKFSLNNKNVNKKIIKKIEFIQKNKKERDKVINNAYSYSLNFSWIKNINKIINLSLK